jgi:hypothetical protein
VIFSFSESFSLALILARTQSKCAGFPLSLAAIEEAKSSIG